MQSVTKDQLWVSIHTGVAGIRTEPIPVALGLSVAEDCVDELCFEILLFLGFWVASRLSPAFARAFVCIVYSVLSLWSLMGCLSRFSLQALISLILPSILCVEVLSPTSVNAMCPVEMLLLRHCCALSNWKLQFAHTSDFLFLLLFVCLHSIAGWKLKQGSHWDPLVLCKATAMALILTALIGFVIYLILIDILFVTKKDYIFLKYYYLYGLLL